MVKVSCHSHLSAKWVRISIMSKHIGLRIGSIWFVIIWIVYVTRHTKFAAGPRRYDEEFDWNCAVPWPALAISQKLT